jgi:hypothetical protein
MAANGAQKKGSSQIPAPSAAVSHLSLPYIPATATGATFATDHVGRTALILRGEF